ncbi:MAG: glycosyltransferase family 4 protein, partial [Blastocatellia bacterium]
SYSRGLRGDPRELARILSRYRGFRERYYSPHLSDTVVSIQARTIATSVRNPISTLVCTHNLNIEGAPLVQLELTLGLKDRGVIDPVVYSPQDGPLRAEYERRGVRVEIHPHPVRWVAPTPEGYKFGIETLARWAKSLGVDLVYGNTLQTFYAIEAARIAGLPSVWNPRESEDWRVYFNEFGPVAALNALECFSYPYQVVFVSKASKNTFLDLCSHRNFAHIHDGLDRAAFLAMLARTPRCEARHRLGLGEDEIAIITVGSICERKGQLDIIGAVAAMDDETVRRIRWFIIGDRPHPYSTDLHAAWEALDVARGQRLTIVPETPDVAIYYSAADVFVCTSRVESFPRVILEAEAAGLPIVTTPAFGIAEEVFVDHNAIFIGPGDVAGLAGAVSSLVAAPTLRRRMGAMSRTVLDIITDYNSMVEAYADVFREAWLSGKPRGSDVAGNMNAD